MQSSIAQQYGVLSQFLPTLSEAALPPVLPGLSTAKSAFRVLIMETSVPLARLLATGLVAERFSVDVTHDLNSAREHFAKSPYDLFIVDLDMPDMDGLQVLRSGRSEHPEVRILALSRKEGTEHMVTALDHGADEYLPKPFSLLEMMARVRVLHRRSRTIAPTSTPKNTNLVLHRDHCRVERDGRLIDLTPREFTLLEYMIQNAGKMLSRSVLTQEVWNMPAEGSTNIVDVYIKYLRDKLDGDHEIKLIRTVRGMGYVYQA